MATRARQTKSVAKDGEGGAASTGQRRGRPRLDQAGQLDGELLRQALDHFLDKGYAATTMNAITRSLGMSKQTVYSRYADKYALFRAALQCAIDEWLAPVKGLQEYESEDFEETLVAAATVLVRMTMSPTGLRLIRITNAESYRMPEIGRHTYGKGYELFATYLRDLFRRRLPLDDVAPDEVEDLIAAFVNLLSGPARLNAWGLDAAPVDIDVFVRKRVRLFLSGVCGFLPDEGRAGSG